jgi:outer membrane protein assembly factor BamD
MLEVVVGLLARHELYVARYYLREDNFEAANARVERVMKVIPVSGLEPEALVLLGEIYLKQKRKAEARKLFEQVLAEHPDSPFTVPARNFLAHIGEPVGVLRQAAGSGPATQARAATPR